MQKEESYNKTPSHDTERRKLSPLPALLLLSLFYCKPLGAGRGWLHRVYPEPWQCLRETKGGLELVDSPGARITFYYQGVGQKWSLKHTCWPPTTHLRDRRACGVGQLQPWHVRHVCRCWATSHP